MDGTNKINAASLNPSKERNKKMKQSLLILILIMIAACAPRNGLPPGTQTPIPSLSANDSPSPREVGAITPYPQCACPGALFPSSQPQGGFSSTPTVICNCPAQLLSPTISVADVGGSTQDIPSNGITLADNGKTVIIHPRDSFLLNLGIDTYNWSVNIDDQNILSRVKNVMVIRGAQGIYAANKPGQAVLTAVGDPLCRNSIPVCGAPSLLFKITVIVQ